MLLGKVQSGKTRTFISILALGFDNGFDIAIVLSKNSKAQHAQNYERGDVIRYSKGSKPLSIEAGEYARVTATDRETNTVTVKRRNGEELSMTHAGYRE